MSFRLLLVVCYKITMLCIWTLNFVSGNKISLFVLYVMDSNKFQHHLRSLLRSIKFSMKELFNKEDIWIKIIWVMRELVNGK